MIVIRKISDSVPEDLEDLIVVSKPNYGFFKLKYLQIKEILRNVRSSLSKRLFK